MKIIRNIKLNPLLLKHRMCQYEMLGPLLLVESKEFMKIANIDIDRAEKQLSSIPEKYGAKNAFNRGQSVLLQCPRAAAALLTKICSTLVFW